MASVKNITMREYNGTDYDTLYPKTIASQVNGVYNKTETDALLANKLSGIESTDYPGCYYRTVAGVVEWFNPPMVLGNEYRTTERYLGKPVYAKVVNLGACPSSSAYKDVKIMNSNEIAVRIEGRWSYGGVSTLPFESSSADRMEIAILGKAVRIFSGGNNFSSYTANATIYYTKSTD